MKRLKNRLDVRDDQGAVAITVGILLVAFMGFAAFSIDAGLAYAVDRQHSVTADGAALAGAQAAALEYKDDYPGVGPGCTAATANAVEPAAAAAAQEVYDDNDVDGTDDPVVTDVTCEDGNFLVTVTTGSEVDTVFGGVFGVDTLTPGATATAIVSGAPAYGGLRPYAVCVDDFPSTGADPTDTYQSEFPQHASDDIVCASSSGQWGVMDFNDGSNPTGDIANWTEFGYPGAVTFPADIQGDPGANMSSSQIKNALKTLVNSTGDPANDVAIMLPVVDGWVGGGGGAEVHAPGVVTAKLCGFSLNPAGAPVEINSTCWDPALYATADPHSKFVFQWQYESYVTSFTTTGSGASCDLGDADCVPAIRLWRNP